MGEQVKYSSGEHNSVIKDFTNSFGDTRFQSNKGSYNTPFRRRRPKTDVGKDIKRDQVEKAVEEYLKEGGKIFFQGDTPEDFSSYGKEDLKGKTDRNFIVRE